MTVMCASELTVLDETVGLVFVNETEMKPGAEYVNGTGPLKPLYPVRVSVVDPPPPGTVFIEVELAEMLKSGAALLSQICSSGPKLP